jgi:glycosyltransferase involved in cell wall biosynthesis
MTAGLPRRPQPAAALAGASAGPPQRLVAVLCPGTPLSGRTGGIGTSLGNLLAELGASAPDIVPLLIDTRGDGHIALSPFFLARAAARIAGSARRLALLHVNMSGHGSAARKTLLVNLAATLRIPVLVQLHGADFDSFYRGLPAPARAVLRRTLARADHGVVLGEHWRRFIIEEIALPPGRVSVIANGVPRPAPAPRPHGPPRLLFLGRLEPRKGVAELIDALGTPALRERGWAATLAGDGDPSPYMAQAERLGIGARLSFPGWVGPEAVARLLRAAHCLLLPSHAEALPMAVIEALAHGVPVVTTPVGALPDYLQHEGSALFVPPGDVATLAAAIERLLDEAALQAALAEGGRAVFARHFDIAAVAAQIAGLYRAIASAHGR